MAYTPRIRVAICGGGIGGLTCALALSKYSDIEIIVYEAATRLTEVGAGVGVFPRPWKILQMLGVDKELLEYTETKPVNGPQPSVYYRKSDQPEGFEFYTLMTQGVLITLHRADFQQVLLRHLSSNSSVRTYTSKRLRSYYQPHSGPVTLQFEDGTSAHCDVLIGADGLKSSVRKTLVIEKARWAQGEGRIREAGEIMSAAEPIWSGTCAYRALIPAEKLRARWPDHKALFTQMQYLGKGNFIMAYPVQRGTMVNFVAFNCQHHLEGTRFNGPWVSVVDRSAFANYFAGWEPAAQVLIDCVEQPLQWAVHTVKPMGSFISGRVALLGDAAHASLPTQGSGAGSAMEDAMLLATVLGHRSTTPATLSRNLHIYDQIRRPLALRVHEKSRFNAKAFTFSLDGYPDYGRLGGASLMQGLNKLARDFTTNWEWAWTTSIDDSLQEAQQRLARQNMAL